MSPGSSKFDHLTDAKMSLLIFGLVDVIKLSLIVAGVTSAHVAEFELVRGAGVGSVHVRDS